jgi:anti-anti-sigma factor
MANAGTNLSGHGRRRRSARRAQSSSVHHPDWIERAARDEIVLELNGEVDAADATALHDALATTIRHARGRRVVVDLTDVDFLDAASLSAILDTQLDAQLDMSRVTPAAPRLRLRSAERFGLLLDVTGARGLVEVED